MKFHRRILSLLLGVLVCAVTLLPGVPARAQQDITLSTLTIKLWPEFDQPNVLVFYIGQVKGASGAVDLHFTLPPGAVVNAVAYLDPASGQPSDKLTKTVNGSDVTMTSPNGSFHIEFYDSSLKTTGSERAYQFTWNSPYAVDQLNWVVQQPAGASALKIDPASSQPGTDELGLTMQSITVGRVEAGQVKTVSISYTKTGTKLTAEVLAEQAPPSPAAAAPTSTSGGSEVTLLIVAIVVAVVLGAAFTAYYFREMRPGGKPKDKIAPSADVKGKAQPQQRFCTECGTLARADDKFCRKCGAKLKPV